MKSLLKKLLAFAVVLMVIGLGFYLGRKVYKRSHERRLVQDARTYLETRDMRNAQLCLQRALQINPLNIEAFRLMAEMLEAVAAPASVGWRARIVELAPGVLEYRLDWAEAAIRTGEFASATNALAGVDEDGHQAARYWKLKGAVAWGSQQLVEAESCYRRALELESTNLVTAANLATIHLLSTNQATVIAARESLEGMTTNPPVRMAALRHLRNHAVSQRGTNHALRYSSEIVNDASAPITDKLEHLTILQATGSPALASYLSTVKAAAKDSSPAAFAVGRWLARDDSTTNALTWLLSLSEEVQTNQPVPLIISDCLISTKDWRALLNFAAAQDWLEWEYYRLAVLSLAERSLSEETAARTSWRRALREANGRLDRLTQLVQLARSWRWASEYEQVLTQITGSFPKEKWAVDALVQEYYAAGRTREIERVLSDCYRSNTNDLQLKNNFANVLLLRKSQLDLAHALAKDAYESSPKDPFVASTYAFSLSLQERHEEAARVVDVLDPASLKIPVIAVYYGTIQIQSGRKEFAKDAIACAETAPLLLPEERELVRKAKAAL